MRIQNSLKNMLFGLSGQVISAIMGFIVRTVFISTLGIEYLGINGLFTNILTLFSLANLGFDTAIIYSLYKPLAEKDKLKVQGLMNLYEKAYRWIGLIILVIGLALLPFITQLTNEQTTVQQIKVIYLLFLLNSVSSYYFVYKQSIIIADQHNHILSKINSVFSIILSVLQMILLVSTKNFIIVLSAQIVIGVAKNIYISNKAIQLYPYLNEGKDVRLSKEDRLSFFKNLYSLMLYRISGVVINGTDNIVISIFVGLVWVGIYSNYLLIIATLNTFLSYIFYSITASVGNLNVNENAAKKYFVFRVLNFSNFWVYGFCSVSLWNLLNPFITLWLGDQYVLSKFIVFAIILDFYTAGMQNASTTFRDTTGLFQKGKYRPVYAAVINIVMSIMLAQTIGLAGVLLGTVISRLCTYFWYDPYVIFKYVFHKPVMIHFIRYLGFGVIVVTAAIITDVLGNTFQPNGQINLVIKAVLCLLIPNALFYMLFKKLEEFEYLFNIAKSIIKKLHLKRIEKKVSSI
jgi:O-antigen/teichoic acid export membrane protein